MILALTCIAMPAKSQILITDDETNNRATTEFNINNPGTFDSGEDWYLPIGSGLWVLAGLGGAYLVTKKRKKN